MEIEDFYPKYLDISNDKFYNSIYLKKEFHDNILSKYENYPKKMGELMKHQKTIKYFLSSHTPYNNLLLYHMPGSGKTCTTISVIEEIKSEGTMNGALIFASGQNLLNNYLNELVYKCTDGKYIPEVVNSDETEISDVEKFHQIKKLTSFYKFYTFESFSNYLKSIKNIEFISRNFNKYIIVIDEAHNLRNVEELNNLKITDKSQSVYSQFWKFLHNITDCKILLLSGTPVKDNPKEISSLMNLILPLNNQFSSNEDIFAKEYLIQNEKNNRIRFKSDAIQQFQKKIRGYVSYVENMKSEVPQFFVGNMDIGNFIIHTDEMSEFQTLVYMSAYSKDKSVKNIYSYSRQAILFVFPDGTYGSDGFNKHIKKSEVKNLKDQKEKVYTFSLDSDTYNKIYNPDDFVKLENIKKYSSKFASTISNILFSKKEGKNIFVYCEFVNGSGLILFSILLSLFGYTKATGKETTKGPRYVVLSNVTTTTKQIKDIIARFNEEDNSTGDYIQVIIGSKIISEGISFFNIQEIEILTPHWNFSEIFQAIYRGYRYNSFNALLKKFPNKAFENRVHLKTSLLNERYRNNTRNIESIDYKMYVIAEEKEYGIIELKKILRSSAIDCQLNYDRNFGGLEYKCFGIDNSTNEIDTSSFNLFFSSELKKKIIEETRKIFKNIFSIEFQDLLNKLQQIFLPDILDPKILIITLQEIIQNYIIIINNYGFPNFLRESNDIYFLVEHINMFNDFSSSYYSENLNLKRKIDFYSLIKEKQKSKLKNIKDDIFKLNNIDKIKNILNKLSFSIKEEILEDLLYFQLSGQELNIFQLEILKYYENFYTKFIVDQIPDVFEQIAYVSWLDPDRIRVLYVKYNLNENSILLPLFERWENADESIVELYKNLKKNQLEKIDLDKYSYSGQFSKETNEFCIKNLKIEGGKGRRCLNWSLDDLLRIILFHLKIDLEKFNIQKILEETKELSDEDLLNEIINKNEILKEIFKNRDIIERQEMIGALYFSEMKIKELCIIIREDMEEKQILIEDASCGQQKKRKQIL